MCIMSRYSLGPPTGWSCSCGSRSTPGRSVQPASPNHPVADLNTNNVFKKRNGIKKSKKRKQTRARKRDRERKRPSERRGKGKISRGQDIEGGRERRK